MKHYTTIEQITNALEGATGPMQVVLMPGNDRCSIWPMGHPCGFSVHHPASITVYPNLNGINKEFLRDRLNRLDGWAVTGDEKPADSCNSMAQKKFDFELVESKRHKTWRQIKEHGPATNAQAAKIWGVTGRGAGIRFHQYFRKGDYTREVTIHPSNGRKHYIYTASTEPPFTAHRQIDHCAMDGIEALLKDHGPMSRADIEAETGMEQRDVSACLKKLREFGKIVSDRYANKLRPIWRVVK